MATGGESVRRNDSGILDDIDKQCDDDPIGTSTEDQLHTAEPVSEQESVSQSITVSKDGPVHETETNDQCQSALFVTEEENKGYMCEPPIPTMQQPACNGQQDLGIQEYHHRGLEKEPTLEQELRLLQATKIQVEHCAQNMRLQKMKYKQQKLEHQRESEELDHKIMMYRKLKELESIQQEVCQHRSIDTFRQGDTDIKPGLLPDVNCHSVSANVEDSEIEGQARAQEHGQHDELKSEEKCSPVEEVTTRNSAKDSIVTGIDKLQVEQPADASKDEEKEHNFPPDFDGKGVLIAMPGSSNTGPHSSHTYEALMLKEAQNIAPGATFTFYHRFDAAFTAIYIDVLTDKWLQHIYDNHNFHTFIICVPSTWNYNRELETAINRAQSEGIVFVCAAEFGMEGSVYPAALGCCFAIGEQSPDISASYGVAIDHVEPGRLVHHTNGSIHGASISAARFTGHLASLCELLYRATGNAISLTPVLKEFLLLATTVEYTSRDGYGKADFKSLMQRPVKQIEVDLAQIMVNRDRNLYQSNLSRSDAKVNTKLWHTLDPTTSLSGGGVTLAMIDDISNDYLTHIQKSHSIRITQCNKGIKYFYIYSKDLMQECCKPHHKDNHALQCGAIIANTSPNTRLLLIKHSEQDDPGEEIALKVVTKERPHILLVSAVTTDTFTKFCNNLAAILSSCVVICAAGNEGKTDRNTICYPARAGNLIVVGACDRLGNRCVYSSVGRELSLMCPGEFDIADSAGRGGTCYAAAAAGAYIAQFLQLVNSQVRIHTTPEAKGDAILDLLCNTHLMKWLLCNPCMGLCCRAEHSSTEGYGMLQIGKLSTVTPELIIQVVKKFSSKNYII